MDDRPLISVIMSVYNEEEYIEDAINSILSQTESDFELIIIDDCSNDRTVEIIKDINDSRIILICNDYNQGLTKNLNKALDICRGKYIARMDGDDISLANRFQSQIDYLNKHHNVELISCNTKTIGNKHLVSDIRGNSEELKCKMILRPQLAHPGFMMDSKIISEYGYRYDEHFRSAQDYDFVSRVCRNINIGVHKKCLLKYRSHGKQVSQNSDFHQNEFANEVRLNILKELGLELNDNLWDAYIAWVYERESKFEDYLNNIKVIELILEANVKNNKNLYNKKVLKRVLWQQYFEYLLRTRGISYIFSVCGTNCYRYYMLLTTGLRMVISKCIRKYR